MAKNIIADNRAALSAHRGHFSGHIGFVIAAAGSAVGLGNIWRFPYLAAKDGGGLFLCCYIILALTFGFALLTTEVAIGRKTKQSPLTAYGIIHHKFKGIGILACIVPVIILPYYCTIGGWVFKYLVSYVRLQSDSTVSDGYFTNFIASPIQPVVFGLLFLLFTAAIVYGGVKQGIEHYSRILMPSLFILIVAIAIYSLTLEGKDGRTGLEGCKMYFLPDFSSVTLKSLVITLMDALGQLFFSISVAMGIMVSYGSYVHDDVNLVKSINQIELFDTLVAFIAGMMIVPAVYVFMGREGMASGPGLIFVTLPKVFKAMGRIGGVIALLFFVMVLFAAVTSCVSVMEAIVSSIIDCFKLGRKKSVLFVSAYAVLGIAVVCLGYNVLYFELPLPNGNAAQILDVADYISNNIFMPLVALLTCILVGWVIKPDVIIKEAAKNGEHFRRQRLYAVMVKFVSPIMLFLMLLQSIGFIRV